MWLRVDLGFVEHVLVSPSLLEPHDTFLVNLNGCRPLDRPGLAAGGDTVVEDGNTTGRNRETQGRFSFQVPGDGVQANTRKQHDEQSEENDEGRKADRRKKKAPERSRKNAALDSASAEGEPREGTAEMPYPEGVKDTAGRETGRSNPSGEAEFGTDRQVVKLTLVQSEGKEGELCIAIRDEKTEEKRREGHGHPPSDALPGSSRAAPLSPDRLKQDGQRTARRRENRDGISREL